MTKQSSVREREKDRLRKRVRERMRRFGDKKNESESCIRIQWKERDKRI